MKIIDLAPENNRAIERVAMLLVEGFRDTGSTSWRNLDDALAEVQESLQPGRISRIGIDEQGNVLGWIGGIEAAEEGLKFYFDPSFAGRRSCRIPSPDSGEISAFPRRAPWAISGGISSPATASSTFIWES